MNKNLRYPIGQHGFMIIHGRLKHLILFLLGPSVFAKGSLTPALPFDKETPVREI